MSTVTGHYDYVRRRGVVDSWRKCTSFAATVKVVRVDGIFVLLIGGSHHLWALCMIDVFSPQKERKKEYNSKTEMKLKIEK